MRYRSTICTATPELLNYLHPGQWIDYDGVKGRYMGRRNGTVWIAWGKTAKCRDRFRVFADCYNNAKATITHVDNKCVWLGLDVQ